MFKTSHRNDMGSIELSPLKSRDDPWISIGRSDGKRLDARA